MDKQSLAKSDLVSGACPQTTFMDSEVLKKSQLRFRVFDGSKLVLNRTLVLIAIVLVVLPFWTSFQDALTKLIMNIGWYKNIQNVLVPYELRILGTILSIFQLSVKVGNAHIEWVKPSGESEAIFLAWNCVGWQTLILFVVTLITGLSGRHTLVSKGETLAIGILGTYLINIARLVLVVIVYFWVGRPLGIIFHDYFSNLLTLGWLFFFWWFSYSFVLENRR